MKKKNEIRWILLSAAIGLLAGCICLINTGKYGLGDSDYYWHSSLGKYIIESGTIPKKDIFSWLSIEKGYLETAHSWLGSVIIWLFSGAFLEPLCGAAAFIFVFVACISFLMSYLYGKPFDTLDRKFDFLNCFFSIFAGLSITLTLNPARPGTIGLLCFLAGMYLLQDAYAEPDSKKWCFLPLVSIAWANLHGGAVPILIAFNVLFLVMALVPRFSFVGIIEETGRKRWRIKRMAALLAADISAALINPYGYKLFVYFFLTNTETTKKYVSEWQPIALKNLVVLTAIAILIGVFSIDSERKRIRFSYIMPVVATFAMTVKYCRIQSYLIITAVMLAWQCAKDASGEWRPKRFNSLSAWRVSILLLICCVPMLLAGKVSMTEMINGSENDPDRLSEELIECLKKTSPERMYCDYNTGGFLIFHGFKSFIDSRADPFPDDVLEKAVMFSDINGMSSSELCDYISEYRFDALLLDKNANLNAWLEENEAWRIQYADDDYCLYSLAS